MTIEIEAIELNNGFFIKRKGNNYRNHNFPSAFSYNDGMTLHSTHSSDWQFIARKITSVTDVVSGEKINERFELKNPEMESDHIPLLMPKEEVTCCDCSHFFCGCDWKDDYSHLRSLYTYLYDTLPDSTKPVEFTWTTVGKATVDFEYTDFMLNIGKDHSSDPATPRKLGSLAEYKNIEDSILYPSVMCSELPCMLPSNRWYAVIRAHINSNIDPRFAYVSSNYKFCLTVKKKCFKTIEESVLSVGKKALRAEEVVIFETSPSSYNAYSVIPPISGENYQDLMEKINFYLSALMEKINKPTCVCDKCNGHGYVY